MIASIRSGRAADSLNRTDSTQTTHGPKKIASAYLCGNDEPWQNAAGMTVAECERRLLTACKTLRALPDRERRFQIVSNCWPEMLREVEEAYGYTEAVMPRFRPSPADVSDCLTALSWARCVSRTDWRLVWWRSFPIGFRLIGAKLNTSHETARARYRDVLLRIWMHVPGNI